MTYTLLQFLALIMSVVTWYPVGVALRNSDERR